MAGIAMAARGQRASSSELGGLLGRLLHVHQHDHAQVEERGHDAREDADQRERPVPGADRRGEHAHLRDEPGRGRDAGQREQEQRHEPGQERARRASPA